MKNVHVSTHEFKDLFLEFSRHSDTDRWPVDHPEEMLRGRPKDGVSVLLSPSGYRVKCAARLEGLPPGSAVLELRAHAAHFYTCSNSALIPRLGHGKIREWHCAPFGEKY